MKRLAILLAAGALAAAAQQKTFEVASIKPSAQPGAPMPGGGGIFRVSMGPRFGPGTGDPTRWACDNCPLKLLITMAFQLKDFQVTGPNWLDSERFDISARVAEGATKEDLRLMQQSLLADRFGLKFHMEQKEMQVYDLVQGPKGHKMKVSTAAAPTPPEAGAPPPMPAGMGRGGPLKMGADGFPEVPAGRTITMNFNGNSKHVAVGEDIDQFVSLLSANLNRPVTNSTGLTGRFDFTLTFTPPPNAGRGGPGSGMMMMIGRGPGGPGGAGGEHAAETAETESAPPLQKAIQDQLGLRLEAKKAMADMMIIDKIEKTASDN